MFLQDSHTHCFGGAKHGSVGNSAAKGRSQSDYGGDIFGSLAGERTCNDPTQAVPDKVNLSPGLGQRRFDCVTQVTLYEQIWAFSIDANAGEVGLIANPPQPAVQFCQINIRAQETRNDDDGRAIPAWDTKAIIDRSCVQQQNFGAEKGLGPK